MTESSEIRRSNDGAIDTAFYMKIARYRRSVAFRNALAAAARFIFTVAILGLSFGVVIRAGAS